MRKVAALSGLLSFLALVLSYGVPRAGATAAPAHALINGSGSGWSANAVNQWIADVQAQGLQVVYTAVGSAQGRKDFAYKTTDYAVSDIGYQGHDEVSGDTDTSQGRDYAYLPIVAGGTAFPYHVEVAGQLVRTIRLSGLTLAKIFTNQITNWNDPAIAADNNHRFLVGDTVVGSLPSIPIVPVVHSEGAGTTAQFTTYLDTQYASLWRPFNDNHSGFTEYYPRKGTAIAQNGSDGVMNYVASSAANGAIGYDEYSYALAKNYPVVKVLNSAGFYTLPTQYNVAVALTHAIINPHKNSPNYLLQDLHNVYTATEDQVYPLSSYSYGIIPTASNDAKMTTAKRQTLADFLSYSICAGQREMGPIGYSPLPLNLVQASFQQIGKLKKADGAVVFTPKQVTTCNNPTFDGSDLAKNCLAIIAPEPAVCDKIHQGPCPPTDTGRANANPVGCSRSSVSNGQGGGNNNGGSGNGGSGGSGGNGGPDGTGTGGTGGTGPGGSGTPTPGASDGPTGGGDCVIDPVTGQCASVIVPGGGSSSDPNLGLGAGGAIPVATEVDRQQPLSLGILVPLAVLLLLGLVAGPPLLARRLAKPTDKAPGS
jgi:ABC-type phosphate transport system substrate-binding protein